MYDKLPAYPIDEGSFTLRHTEWVPERTLKSSDRIPSVIDGLEKCIMTYFFC